VDRLARDGVGLCFEDVGKGAPPIVLVHDLAGDHTCFAPQIEHFRRDHRVVAVDLRGHGQSDQPEQGYTVSGFADDVAWLCYELGVYKPVVVGHGLGGVIAVDLAARYPDLSAGIVALDSVVLPLPEVRDRLLSLVGQLRGPGYPTALQQLVEGHLLPTDGPWLRDHILELAAAAPAHVVISACEEALAWDGATALASSLVPLLYVEAAAPLADLARLREACPRLLVGKTVGAGHFHQLVVPEQVNAMLDRFLAVRLVPPG